MTQPGYDSHDHSGQYGNADQDNKIGGKEGKYKLVWVSEAVGCKAKLDTHKKEKDGQDYAGRAHGPPDHFPHHGLLPSSWVVATAIFPFRCGRIK